MKVVCVGDCGIDLYVPSGETGIGGISANFARHAYREFDALDTIQLVSAVGNDDHADAVCSALEESGVECHIAVQTGVTPVQTIQVQEDGERLFVKYEEGVLKEFSPDQTQSLLIRDSDLLVVPVYVQIRELFEKVMAIPTKGKVSVDFADFREHPDFDLLDQHMATVDIGFFGLSVDDTALISQVAERAATHSKLLIVTMGPAGSIAFDGANKAHCPATPVEIVVDTTGAGDAFAAGFLSRYCSDSDLSESLLAGANLAAEVVQIKGASLNRA